MKIAVCYNTAAPSASHGEPYDVIADEETLGEAEEVAEALSELGHAPVIVPFGADVALALQEVSRSGATLIFNLCEGLRGKSRLELHAAAMFELMGLPVTGSGPLTLGLAQDKLLTKTVLLAAGLRTPPFRLASLDTCLEAEPELDYPLMVKPRYEDASHGISAASVVDGYDALCLQVRYLHRRYRQDALIETFIDGRELNVGIVGNGADAVVLPLSEIVFDRRIGRPIVGYDAKWLEETPAWEALVAVCPAALSDAAEAATREAALQAYRLLGCRDYARVDLRLRDDVPWILEVNPNPYLRSEIGLARSAEAAGIPFPDLIARIIDMTMQRAADL